MAARPPTRKASSTNLQETPQTSSDSGDKPGSLDWMKGLLGRSISLEQRRNQLHVVLVDRRRALGARLPDAGSTPTLLQIRAELRALLLVHEHDHDSAVHVMRHLVFVHDELGRTGWAGVEALPPQVTAKALVEAEMLASHESSPLLAIVVARLQAIKMATDLRAEHEQQQREWEMPAIPEVSEGTHEEYDRMERSWVGTVPTDLADL